VVGVGVIVNSSIFLKLGILPPHIFLMISIGGGALIGDTI
jgi:hypothetical protein